MSNHLLPTAEEYGIVNILDVVTEIYGIEVAEIRRKHGSSEAFFRCVSHKPDNNPSCSVNLKTGYFRCFSCGTGGDIISLGAKALNKTRLEVAALHMSNVDDIARKVEAVLKAKATYDARRYAIETHHELFPFPPLDEYTDQPMDYMYDRGFDQHTLDSFQVKFVWKGKVLTRRGNLMTLFRSIAVPVFDEFHAHAGWLYRATPKSPDWQPRYLYTPGMQVASILFGYTQAYAASGPLVVTEGPLDAMWVSQCGYRTVATFGSSNVQNAHKINLLLNALNLHDSLILFGDRDEAGARFVHKLYDLTANHASCKIFRYRSGWNGTDANSLTAEQVRWGIDHAIPYHDWIIRNNLTEGIANQNGLHSRNHSGDGENVRAQGSRQQTT